MPRALRPALYALLGRHDSCVLELELRNAAQLVELSPLATALFELLFGWLDASNAKQVDAQRVRPGRA